MNTVAKNVFGKRGQSALIGLTIHCHSFQSFLCPRPHGTSLIFGIAVYVGLTSSSPLCSRTWTPLKLPRVSPVHLQCPVSMMWIHGSKFLNTALIMWSEGTDVRYPWRQCYMVNRDWPSWPAWSVGSASTRKLYIFYLFNNLVYSPGATAIRL